jgi:hypothetical protein
MMRGDATVLKVERDNESTTNACEKYIFFEIFEDIEDVPGPDPS